MPCPKCGAETTPQYCFNCGAAIVQQLAMEENKDQANTDFSSSNKLERNHYPSKSLLLGAFFIGILLLIHEFVFVYGFHYEMLLTSSGIGYMLERFVWCFGLGLLSMLIAKHFLKSEY
jgi:hypothetical protein